MTDVASLNKLSSIYGTDGATAALLQNASTTSTASVAGLDAYELAGTKTPGAPQFTTAAEGPQAQETQVQPGTGDIGEQLSAEFGSLAAALLKLLGQPAGGNGPAKKTVSPLNNANSEPAVVDPSTTSYMAAADATLWGDGEVENGSGTQKESLSNEVDQGADGDCYFLSTLASVAAANPQALKDMVRPDPNGNPNDYQVRFYQKNAEGQPQAVWVSVDDKFPVDKNGMPVYQGIARDGTGQPIIGMALIEKAYAKFNDSNGDLQQEGAAPGKGYNGIGNGGTGAESLLAITGQAPTTVGYGGVSLQQQGESTSAVKAALSQANAPTHAPVTAGTVQSGGTVDANGVPRLPDGVICGHQYSVLGTYTDPTTGQTMVTLRNPWGGDAAGEPGATTQGVFSISLTAFKKDFGDIQEGSFSSEDTSAPSTASTTSAPATLLKASSFQPTRV